MKILVYKKQSYEVYITNSSLVVINMFGEYENHAHLTKTVDSKGKIKLRKVYLNCQYRIT